MALADHASPTRGRWKRAAGFVLGLGLPLLFVPELPDPPAERPPEEAFVWAQDEVWGALQQRFDAARRGACPAETQQRLDAIAQTATALGTRRAGPEDTAWDALEQDFFAAAADLGACPSMMGPFLRTRNAVWIAAKTASRSWPRAKPGRDRLYRLLYGSRAATEELLLQHPRQDTTQLNQVAEVPSSAPSIEVQGVVIHSGDLLVSRGGAPTSAFIARGSDYPGNFSHVALVHVGDDGSARVIEAHIERGVAVSTPEAYFADKKLRVLVLRLQPDHPALARDPLLAHRAAERALAETKARHIPYDFAMDFANPKEQFCSEVASTHYAAMGVHLWQSLSAFSSPGLARWMSAFGVTHLRTHGPSDLEYDPQLAVVAEWHDRETLFDDHVDNAVIDVMLESAERGEPLRYDLGMLPVARLAKAYSMVLNLAGREGPVPEGMSATVGLRASWLAERHGELKAAVLANAKTFELREGRPPAYWELLELARAAAAESV